MADRMPIFCPIIFVNIPVSHEDDESMKKLDNIMSEPVK